MILTVPHVTPHHYMSYNTGFAYLQVFFWKKIFFSVFSFFYPCNSFDITILQIIANLPRFLGFFAFFRGLRLLYFSHFSYLSYSILAVFPKKSNKLRQSFYLVQKRKRFRFLPYILFCLPYLYKLRPAD